MDISFEDLKFEILHDGSNLSSFLCEDSDLYEFLTEDALSSQKKKLSVTRLAIYNDEVVGFFTLVNDCIETKAIAASDSDRGYPYARYPAMKIARLAMHDNYRGRDIGTNMLLKILIIFCRIYEYVGCRFMTVDSKPEAAGFYQKFGFKTASGITRIPCRCTRIARSRSTGPGHGSSRNSGTCKANTSSGSCDLHEQRGTLHVDKKDLGQKMCPACDMRGRCETEGSVEKLSVYCL